MPRVPSVALCLPVLLAAACTTVPPAERAAACRATDWSSYGYNDGLLGVPAADRAKHFADCAELGHPADTAAYEAGRTEGLARYCTVESGYQAGYAGRRYRDVCPPGLARDFVQGYEQGRKDRPIQVYPSFGIGVGFGHFGSSPYWHRHHHHHPRRYKDGE